MKIRKLKKLRQEKNGRGYVTSFRTQTEIWTSYYNVRMSEARMWVTESKMGSMWR